jgi:hypothetical protein
LKKKWEHKISGGKLDREGGGIKDMVDNSDAIAKQFKMKV